MDKWHFKQEVMISNSVTMGKGEALVKITGQISYVLLLDDGLLWLTFTAIHTTGLFCPQIAATLAITESGIRVAN